MASTPDGQGQNALYYPPDTGGLPKNKRRQRNRQNQQRGPRQGGPPTSKVEQHAQQTQGVGQIPNQQIQHCPPEASPSLAPSVQHLFDSVSSELTITIQDGGRRRVTHSEVPAPFTSHGDSSRKGSQPDTIPSVKQSQRGQQRNTSESSQGSAHREMDAAWPSLAEAITPPGYPAGEAKEQRFKSPKKPRNRKKNKPQVLDGKSGDEASNVHQAPSDTEFAPHQPPTAAKSAPHQPPTTTKPAQHQQPPTATKSAPEILMKPVTVVEDKPKQEPESGNSEVGGNPNGQAVMEVPAAAAAVNDPQNSEAGDVRQVANIPNSMEKVNNDLQKKKGVAVQPVSELARFLDSYRSKVGVKYIALLDVDHIRPLVKKNPRFPDAHFYCRLCEFHMDTVEDMEEHRKSDDGHLRRIRIKTGDQLLKKMPPPTDTHLQALSNYLENLYSEISLSDEAVQVRKSVIDTLEKDLHENSNWLKEVRLQLCGSLRAGFALKESDTNIRILAPKTANLAKVMTEIFDVLNALEYKDVIKDFMARDPFVSFSVEGQVGRFCLQFSEEGNQITNMLLSCYTKWNMKLKQLAVLFKHVAKIGKMADAGHGALAAYCFPIMTIFFCQQLNLAPVFFQKLNMETLLESEFQGLIDTLEPSVDSYASNIESRSLGELWISLLRFYSYVFDKEAYLVSITNLRKMTKSSKAWSTKRLAIEDPGIPKRNLCKTISHQRVFDFIIDQIRRAYKYFATPQLETGPAFTMLYTPDKSTNNQTSKEHNPQTKNTSKVSDANNAARPDSTTAGPATAPRASNTGTGADGDVDNGCADINDSSNDSRNVVRPLNADIGSDDQSKAIDGGKEVTPEQDMSDGESEGSGVRVLSVADESPCSPGSETERGSASAADSNQERNIPSLKQLSLQAAPSEHPTNVKLHIPGETALKDQTANSSSSAVGSQVPKVVEDITADLQKVSLTPSKAESPSKPQRLIGVAINEELLYNKEKIDALRIEDFRFDFNSEHLKITAVPLPVFCRQCSKANHVIEDCPEEQLPPCVPLPPPSADDRVILSDLLKEIKEQNELCAETLKTRQEFVDQLTYCIRDRYPEAMLTLYGSSCNGFGSAGSDLDICMTLKGASQLNGAETTQVLRDMARLMVAAGAFQDVIPLLHAKVPIVKCCSKSYGLEADISLYNILAQRNTRLLHRYSQIDDRVRILGYTVKEFAKSCEIGDASKGSLSSYAYIIMLIYYLQKCDPPVLPVLQELYKGDSMPEVIVEDWNTWFYDFSNEQLVKDWPGYNKNEMDVAQLWLGFLNFYAQKFAYKSDVVSIRRVGTMSKFEKLWNSDTLAIEDPFDLKRNLASALAKRMNAYILTTFIKARTVFHTSTASITQLPVDQRPSAYKFYFGHKDLPSGGGERAPEHARACRICGKIGHYAKLCPVKTQKRDRQIKLREMRDAANKKAAQENREMERRLSEGDNWRRGTPPRNQQQHQHLMQHTPSHLGGTPGRYQHPSTPPRHPQGMPNQRRGQRQQQQFRQQGNVPYQALGNNATLNQNNNSNFAGHNLAFPSPQGNLQQMQPVYLPQQQQLPGQMNPMGSPIRGVMNCPAIIPQNFYQSVGRHPDYPNQ